MSEQNRFLSPTVFAALTALCFVVLVLLVLKKSCSVPERAGNTVNVVSGEAFIGHSGYILKLPAGYAATQEIKPSSEVVYFAKQGTDPTNFLDQGLYGQLGIVRLEVRPNNYGSAITGLDYLTRLIISRSKNQKYTTKPLQIATMRGVQIFYDIPIAHLEAYIVSDKSIYAFTAGQDDEIFRGIIQSLRDSQSDI